MTRTKKAAAVRKDNKKTMAKKAEAMAQDYQDLYIPTQEEDEAQRDEELAQVTAPAGPIVVITPAEELVSFPDDKEEEDADTAPAEEPQPDADKEEDADKAEDGEPKKMTAAEVTAARQAWLAGTKRAAADMKAEACSLSGLCRALWEYCREAADDTEAKKAFRAKAAKDIMAVGHLDVLNLSRKEFTRAWLDICRTYADAQTEEGIAVTLKPVGAGILKAVEWEPSAKGGDVYEKVVGRWSKAAKAIRGVKLGEYYQRGKGKGAPALFHLHKDLAEKTLSEYKARRDHGRAAGKEAEAEALAAYDARKAAEQA